MNYTREPIIETVLTPKEGCKLLLRNSKKVGQEDYFVDAVEIVSFGQALFFRSIERPKSFLLPVTDYEIVELKETKMVLKSAKVEKSIKIGKAKEIIGKKEEKKGERRRRKPPSRQEAKKEREPSETKEEVEVSAPPRKLFPPPNQLIKRSIPKAEVEEASSEKIPEEKEQPTTKEEPQSKNEIEKKEENKPEKEQE